MLRLFGKLWLAAVPTPDDIVIGPSFFAEKMITGVIYYDMIHEYLLPQALELQPVIMFQQDGAPVHWSLDVPVRDLLNRHFPGRWIGHDGPIAWPPLSHITSLDFFFWGFIKDNVNKMPVPDLATLHRWIVAVDVAMPQSVCMELEYRLDILRTTRGEME